MQTYKIEIIARKIGMETCKTETRKWNFEMQTYKIEIITWKSGMETCKNETHRWKFHAWFCKNEKRYSININILCIF